MFSRRRDLLFHSFLSILPQNILLPFSKSFMSSVLAPFSALQKFLFFSPLGECLRGDHCTSYSFRQCLTVNGPVNTSSIRNSVETLAGFDSVMANCTQRSARQLCNLIDATLDPSVSRPTRFVDGRHTLHVK